MARWTENYDYGKETGWWYCVCDTPFDISALKAKRRNVINNGIKYCDVVIGDPLEYENELFDIYNECQLSYPEKNRNLLLKDDFKRYLEGIHTNENIDFYLCFLKETKECIGYAVVTKSVDHVDLTAQKAKPSYEKYQVNAAIVNSILGKYRDIISKRFYICDGSRNINHETHFQDFLEKYFGFRKAYCLLKIKYRWWVKVVVCILFPFRKMLKKLDSIKIIHLINSVLLMEAISRNKYGT